MAARTLTSDRRGAVLLISVFMSAFLVGALWYVIGIGDAAIYRQYLQDGADAVAFGSAVYHARGMNIIALINLVMAAVLMVLVAFKIGQLLLAAANLISCLTTFLNPLCPATSAAMPPYAQWVMKVEKIVDKILRVLYQTSNAVAIGMPWVAEGKAILVAREYKPTVDGGFMLSISLVPGPVERMAGGLVAKKPAASSGGGATPGGSTTPTGETKKPSKDGMRWGLPVQDDEYSNLCKKAGENVVSLVFLPFKAIGLGGIAGGIESVAGGMVGGFVSFFQGYFCGDMKDAAAQAKSFADKTKDKILKNSKDKAKKICEDKRDKVEKENADRAKKGLPLITDFSFADCMKATGDAFGVLENPGGSSPGEGKTSKKIYDPAQHGDDYFAVWAFGFGDLRDQSGANKGVDIAAWNKAKVQDPSVFSKISLAKAEFYFEPKPDQPKKWGKDWDDRVPGGETDGGLAEDAMWSMRWRARLRRLRLPIPSAGAILATKINSAIPSIPVFGDMLKWPADKMGELIDDKVGEVIGGATSTIITH